MDIDRICHVRYRPPSIGSWADIEPGTRAVAVGPDTSFPSAPSAKPWLHEIWSLRLGAERARYALDNGAPEILHLEGMQSGDLGFLSDHQGLRGLAIKRNTKLETIDFLRGLTGLEALSLEHLPRLRDLEPLKPLKRLESLQLSGGMDTRLDVSTLRPLSALQGLRELRLIAIRIRDGSLEPLASLQRLERLEIANNAASMEAFARLAASLPNVECDQFQPYVPLARIALPRGADPVAALEALGDVDVMVTGKGGPFLNARTDRDRLLRYCRKFRDWQRALQ